MVMRDHSSLVVLSMGGQLNFDGRERLMEGEYGVTHFDDTQLQI